MQIKLCEISLFFLGFTANATQVRAYWVRVSSRLVRSIKVFKDLFEISFNAPILEPMMAGYYH
jgi:hypothetical protein